MPAKKKVRKKKTVKRTTQIEAGKSLREVRAQEMGSTSFWPWPLRPMQQEAYDAFDRGIRRFGLFWHRRAGKDVFGMSVASNEMRKRIGSYVHFFPKHVHAKRALWRGVDPRKGARFIDIAFGDIEADRNNQDMLIEAYNGSTWALLGSDNYDSNVIGGNVVGVVFSEWALCNPKAWEYIRPILRENGGWAMFITTFRGRNHAWQMYQKLKDNPNWYIDLRTIRDTCELDGSPIISEEDVQADRDEDMPESLIQQEYYCNPEASAEGAIYGKQLERLRGDEKRHHAAWNPMQPVYCVWNLDLPIHASYVIAQQGKNGEPPLILDADTVEFCTLNEAIAKAEQRHYPVQQHLIRGDQADYAQHFYDLDRRPLVMWRETLLEGASFIDRCHIDGDHCGSLLDSLGGYVRRERFDAQAAELQFSDRPLYSWHSQLVRPMETFASWEYHLGGGWSKPPDYSAADRLAKTLR